MIGDNPRPQANAKALLGSIGLKPAPGIHPIGNCTRSATTKRFDDHRTHASA